MKTHHRNRWAVRGLNLIELLVVVVIGVLASLAMPAYMKVRDRSSVKAAHKRGIFWAGVISERSTLEAEFGFTSLGTESAEITLPLARRLSQLNLSLNLTNSHARDIASYSLIPSSVDGKVYQ